MNTEQAIYIYDGSFHGLLTVLYEVMKNKTDPSDIVAGQPEDRLLFNDYIHINTDQTKADILTEYINQKLPKMAYKRVILGFLSDAPGSEKHIYNYLQMGHQHQKLLDHYLAHEKVKPLIDLSEKVIKEQHRMLGLVRFKHTRDNIFYSEIGPDHNILPLISSHFARRMSSERWIIHDTKREIATRYHKGEWDIVDFEVTSKIDYDYMETTWQQLWNTYFTTIGITGRKNKKLQRQFLPQRYWKYLVEEITPS